MKPAWPVLPLGSVVELQRGFDLPSNKRSQGSVPVVGSAGVIGQHDEAAVKGPGVTLGRAGAIGVATYVPCNFWPLNTTLFVTNFLGNDRKFVYYLLHNMDFSAYNSGGVQPMLNRNYIRDIPVSLPSYSEQQAIAEVLGALDDKIAINERIADTALALAETMYIRDSATKDGWHETALADTADWKSGGTPNTSEPSYWDGDIPWISAASLKSPWLDNSERRVTSLGATKGTRLVPAGTIVFVVRGMSLASEFRVGLTQREVAFGQDCKALVPCPGVDPVVLLLALRSRTTEILGLVDTAGHGTGRLGTDRIEKLRVRLPEGEAGAAFTESVRYLAQRASATQRENRTLANLRNTLISQLITGKIHIKDAVRVVEDAAS
ncbi:restriction endonuclease subunit S [Streptomyces sp. NBC_00304]|uniref:restriction endonuclease subunit S n=1 Tax=Streptomyces sp. NBC_00304 TaxID=2975706 RepID=UPI002E2B7353|nr:restriction endonuclease subunit S [Streptomyces sp. NBC_00304]